MITKITKNQKPISLDVHLKYRCPNNNCGYEHWLSLLETQTKNFKIVCDCGTVFKPKKIKTLKIIYDELLSKLSIFIIFFSFTIFKLFLIFFALLIKILFANYIKKIQTEI